MAEFSLRQPKLFERLGNIAQCVIPSQTDPFLLLMELKHQFAPQSHGIFYTPPSLARYVVQRARRQIIASGKSLEAIDLLEPSVGSGIFVNQWLLQAQIHQPQEQALDAILQRITCIDLSPAAIVVAQFLLCQQFSKRKVPTNKNFRYPFFAGNTLSAEAHPIYSHLGTQAIPSLDDVLRKRSFDLVIGNPPFASLTRQTDPWTQALLHGQLPDPEGSRSYFSIGEKPIVDKKTWLHDDYVKFVRFAQWHAERKQLGGVALVLNSGFISNLSFRGMRHQLWEAFDQLEIVDFGGDQRNYRDRSDQNVFGIETGIAALIAHTSTLHPHQKTLTRLNGSRAAKLNWRESNTKADPSLKVQQEPIRCESPNFRFDRAFQPKN
ncbi:MAG: hypothetical protein VX438_17915, partial [Planctomycetota bacterium]|nr:hypothetical protein [Planctomycetota bacterium]